MRKKNVVIKRKQINKIFKPKSNTNNNKINKNILNNISKNKKNKNTKNTNSPNIKKENLNICKIKSKNNIHCLNNNINNNNRNIILNN